MVLNHERLVGSAAEWEHLFSACCNVQGALYDVCQGSQSNKIAMHLLLFNLVLEALEGINDPHIHRWRKMTPTSMFMHVYTLQLLGLSVRNLDMLCSG